MNKGALLIVLNQKNEVLLQHKDAGAPQHANQWCLFGGGVEAGETSEQTIKREFKEELDWSIHAIKHYKQFDGDDVFVMRTAKTADELRAHLHEGNDVQFFTQAAIERLDVAEPHKKIISDYFAHKLTNVLFICRGNAFRSIIAEACLNSLQIPGVKVQSRGTAASENPEANNRRFAEVQQLLAHHGMLQFTKKTHAEQLSQKDIDQSDLVICVNDRVFDNCPTNYILPDSTQTWNIDDIGDPGNIAHNSDELLGIEEKTFNKINQRIKQLSEELQRQPAD